MLPGVLLCGWLKAFRGRKRMGDNRACASGSGSHSKYEKPARVDRLSVAKKPNACCAAQKAGPRRDRLSSHDDRSNGPI
jgi:hypothetical protein